MQPAARSDRSLGRKVQLEFVRCPVQSSAQLPPQPWSARRQTGPVSVEPIPLELIDFVPIDFVRVQAVGLQAVRVQTVQLLPCQNSIVQSEAAPEPDGISLCRFGRLRVRRAPSHSLRSYEKPTAGEFL